MADQSTLGKSTLHPSTKLAFERTRVAYERTMMSWIRTATSLITFGFSVYKFFQLEAPPGPPRYRLVGPRQFAFVLGSLGLLALVLAIVEHRHDIKALGVQSANTGRLRRCSQY
jgi:putative membrane protein